MDAAGRHVCPGSIRRAARFRDSSNRTQRTWSMVFSGARRSGFPERGHIGILNRFKGGTHGSDRLDGRTRLATTLLTKNRIPEKCRFIDPLPKGAGSNPCLPATPQMSQFCPLRPGHDSARIKVSSQAGAMARELSFSGSHPLPGNWRLFMPMPTSSCIRTQPAGSLRAGPRKDASCLRKSPHDDHSQVSARSIG